MKIEGQTLICIYSSLEDLPLAEKLKTIILNNCTISKFKVLIVLSKKDLDEDYTYCRFSGKLFLNVKECYTHLSLKTELMIKACSKLFDFNYLIKWDASTIDVNRCYAELESPKFCLKYIKSNKFINTHYSSHLRAKCNGARSKAWFNNNKSKFLKVLNEEGRDLECEGFIPNQVSYFRGKFYIISKDFCDFISHSKECRQIFRKNFQHNFGSEDMSVGMCFEQFKKNHDKR